MAKQEPQKKEYKCPFQIGSFGCSCPECIKRIQERLENAFTVDYVPVDKPKEECMHPSYDRRVDCDYCRKIRPQEEKLQVEKSLSDKVLHTDGTGTLKWTEDWEEEFDRISNENGWMEDYENPNEDKIKAFIKSVRYQVLQEIIKELEKENDSDDEYMAGIKYAITLLKEQIKEE